MTPTHDHAICIRHREWSETSQTVTLLTRTHGLVHGLAKGSLRPKAPYSGGFELLQLGELGFVNKPDRDLTVLTEWDLTDPFPPLRADYRAATIAMFAAEVTAASLAPFDPHEPVFTALFDLLSRLADSQAQPTEPDHPSKCLAIYLAHLLIDTGHALEFESDPHAAPDSDDEIWAFTPATNTFQPDQDRRLPAADPFEQSSDELGVWHLRGETLRRLAALAVHADDPNPPGSENQANSDSEETTRADHADATDVRAARFLAACVCYRTSRRPASLDAFLRVTHNPGASPRS